MELYNNDCSNQSTIVHVIDIAGNVLRVSTPPNFVKRKEYEETLGFLNQSSSSLVNINADVSPNTHIG